MNEVTDQLREMLAGAGATQDEEQLAIGTGRGPTGKLRNFKAMNNTKFDSVFDDIRSEDNDPEAITAVNAEADRRMGLA